MVIAKTGNKLCPVSWLKRYIETAKFRPGSDEYLFTPVQFCRKLGTYKVSSRCSPLSYTRAREILLDDLVAIGLDKTKYCLHSLRSGGVSAAANNQVSDRLLRVHGRWATDKSKDGYIEHSLHNRLLVSRNLFYNSTTPPFSFFFIFVHRIVASYSILLNFVVVSV